MNLKKMLNKQEKEHFDKLVNHMENSEVQHVSLEEEEREYKKRMNRREEFKVKSLNLKTNKIDREVSEINQRQEEKEESMFSEDTDYYLND